LKQEAVDRTLGVSNVYCKARGGYTVIEALIIVVVLGILLVIAYQRMGPALEHAKVNRAAAVLASDLQYARMVAVRSRRPVAVIVMTSVKGYIIRERNGAIVYRERFLGPGTEFGLERFSSSPGSSVEIFPNSVAAATTTFTLGLAGYQRQVKISRAGQVRIVRGP
jgi:Tfp pilus assembly protein FimT